MVVGSERRSRRRRVEYVEALTGEMITRHSAVAIVDPDTSLTRRAVREIVGALAADPEARAVYGDEHRRTTSGIEPVLRPAWSPELLRSSYYLGEPVAVRTASLTEAARPIAADAEARLRMALHLIETDAPVLHLPIVLAERSTAIEAADAAPAIVTEHLARCGVPATAVSGRQPGAVVLEPAFSSRPDVTIVIPTAGARTDSGLERHVERCLRSLNGLTGPNVDLVAVVGDEFDGDPDQLPAASSRPVRVVRRRPGPFSFAAAVNQGVLAAAGDLVVLLNDDVEARDAEWLDRLAIHAIDPRVGAVGAALLYPDDRIQHVGMVVDDARPLHPFVGQTLGGPDARSFAMSARTVAAVTAACLMVERRKFLAVGGLSPRFPLSFNDIDLCFKLARAGHRTVIEPGAVLTHDEGATRGGRIERWEWDRFVHRWGSVVDPWYHPAYVRPGDPNDPRRDADHLLPATGLDSAEPREATIQPRVHHSRTTPGERPAVDR